jgi:predicted nucleotidyltransferase
VCGTYSAKYKTGYYTMRKASCKTVIYFWLCTNKRFNPKSDVDFLIQFDDIDPVSYFDNYMSLKEDLALLLNREVDLVENQAVRNPVLRKVIDREKVLIYERKDIEIPV